jgi:hypothetical protein
MAGIVVLLLLSVACLFGAFVWILLYFYLIERLLQKIVGAIFGVTIGSTIETQRRYYSRKTFSVSGWQVQTPGASSAVARSVWVIGAVLRALFIGAPVGGLLILGVILFVTLILSIKLS